jgi:hypothetical protein
MGSFVLPAGMEVEIIPAGFLPTTIKKGNAVMSNYDWDDVDAGAQDAVELSFPTLQWRNGKSAMEDLGAENINFKGGFFFSTEQAGEETEIKGWSKSSFKTNGKKVEGLACSKAMVSFVRSRRRWFKEMDGKKEFRPWNKYEKGFRAHIQIIGFIKGFPYPVAFPFKGLGVNNIDSVMKEHYSKIVTLANREAPDPKKGLPPYAFWTVVEAGPHEEVGSGTTSEATLPRIYLPKQVTPETVKALYVGRDLLKESQDLYRLAEDWAHRWDSQASGEVTPQELANALQAKAASVSAASNDPYEGGSFDTDSENEIPF